MVGIVKPTNKIVIAGRPVIREFKAAVATVKPGFLVKFVTSDIEITIGGATTGTENLGIGIAGYAMAQEEYKPAAITTAYADDAFIPIIMVGSGVLLMAAVLGVPNRGAALTGQAAAGPLGTATIGTHHIYAILLEHTPVSNALAPVVLL